MPKKPRSASASTGASGHAAARKQTQVQELLRPGQSVDLLKELHILTRDGAINQDSRRKLKQVYHLFGFIEPLLQQLQADGRSDITLADHDAGKSYLGFILYDLFFKQLGSGTVYGIETRPELVEKSTALAQQLGFARMQFLALSVQQASASSALPASFDIVTALHACDTATDDAIAFALQKKRAASGTRSLLPGRSCCLPAAKQSRTTGTHRAIRTMAPPAAHARNRQPAYQRHALPVP